MKMYPALTQAAISQARKKDFSNRTYCDRLLLCLVDNNGTVTTNQFADIYYNFSARLCELKARGIEIEAVKIPDSNLWRYTLKEMKS